MTITSETFTQALVNVNGKHVWATPEQAETLSVLEGTRKGGFARVYGYKADSGRTVPTVYDATVTTRFSYSKLIQRQRDAIQSITVQDILDRAKDNPKLTKLSATELETVLNDRKAKEIDSIDATLKGDRDDAHRAAHDRCYLNVTDGVVIHYVTEKNHEGIKVPTLRDNYPIVDSIMLNCLEVSRNVREPGEYKVVNSGAPVLVSNIIKAIMKGRGVRSMNRVSLKEGKFERVVIDGETVLPEDVVSLMD